MLSCPPQSSTTGSWHSKFASAGHFADDANFDQIEALVNERFIHCYETLAALQFDHSSDWLISARIGGSFSRGEADDVADLDLFFVVIPECYQLDTAIRLAGLLGEYRVLDVPRVSESWGIWTTGYFVRYGYVDIMVRSSAGQLVTYMTDPTSIVVFDRTGYTAADVAKSGPHNVPINEIFAGHSARAWLRVFLAAKMLRRHEYMQSRLYVLEALESIAALRRLNSNAHPPGRNYAHPLKRLASDIPELADRFKGLANTDWCSASSCAAGIRSARDWLVDELGAWPQVGATESGVGEGGLDVLVNETESMLRGLEGRILA